MSEPRTSDLVELEEGDGFAIIRLNRPEKRNAVNREMRRSMIKAMHDIRGKHRVCIIAGARNSFCAGVDLKEYEQDFKSGFVEPESEWNAVLLAIREHPAIFIAAVEGFALGGGLTLIGVCDLAVASQTAKIGMPEMNYGMYPTMAGPAMHLSIPRKRAAWMILTAEFIDGDTAERWNVVNVSVPPDALEAKAQAIAGKLASFDPAALAESKKVFDIIPHQVADWKQAFEYADGVNARIERQSKTVSQSLAEFSKT